MAVRRLAGFAAVLALAGCGSAERAAGPVASDTQAPPITRAESAPPPEVLLSLRSEFGEPEAARGSQTTAVCFHSSGASDAGGGGTATAGTDFVPSAQAGTTCPQPSADELAKVRARLERFQRAIRPAADSAPRVVARLPLDGGGEALFVAWKSSSGALCWQVSEVGPHGDSGGGPSGPCAAEAQDAVAPATLDLGQLGTPCDALCLDSQGGSRSDASAPTTYVLAGTVADDAEALRVTTDEGEGATYPLVGPAVPGTDARVFMLDLGLHDWRKLELVRGAQVVETAVMPAVRAAFEQCSKTVGPPPMPRASLDRQALENAMKPYDDALSACVRAATPRFP